jgi:hypothetical protein
MKVIYVGYVGHHFYFGDTGPRGVYEWIENLPPERRQHYKYRDNDVWVMDDDEALRLKMEMQGRNIDPYENSR